MTYDQSDPPPKWIPGNQTLTEYLATTRPSEYPPRPKTVEIDYVPSEQLEAGAADAASDANAETEPEPSPEESDCFIPGHPDLSAAVEYLVENEALKLAPPESAEPVPLVRARKKSRGRAKSSRPRRRKSRSDAQATRSGSSSRTRLLQGKRRTSAKHLSRLELHRAHCAICGSEYQDEIDESFTSWENVNQIAEDYRISRSIVYRHAHATGLYSRRDRNVRQALGRIIHRADRVVVTADSVIRAVKTLTHINARGDWAPPPTRVIFSTATDAPSQLSVHPRRNKGALSSDADNPQLSGTPEHLIKRLTP
jgi:hypothetical protein